MEFTLEQTHEQTQEQTQERTQEQTQTKTKLIIKKTSSFGPININPNSLVLCDIDDTLIRYDLTLDDFVKKTRDYLISVNDYLDEEYTFCLAKDEFAEYRDSKCPYMTDKKGWDKMYNQIKETCSKLIFITARSIEYKEITRKHFESNELNYLDFDIHYTFEHSMSKAMYIQQYINMDGFDHIYFIDDQVSIVKNVKITFPQIECYIFKYCLQNRS